MKTCLQRLEALGFRLNMMGGNCRAFIRPLNGSNEHWLQIYNPDLSMVDETDEAVYIGLMEAGGEDATHMIVCDSLGKALSLLEDLDGYSVKRLQATLAENVW